MVVFSLVLTGCGKEQPVLYVYNWGDYIDEDILEEFEKETGIKVVYDTYSTNEDMYVKVKSGGSSYDLVFPSDYMLTRMINEGMLLKIDLEQIPNHKHIDPKLMGAEYDPNNEYSLPYMWGLWASSTTPPWLMRRSTAGMCSGILSTPRRSSCWTAKGIPSAQPCSSWVIPSTPRDPQQLAEAAELLKRQKPLVLAYVVDEGKDKMAAGEATLALTWSREAMYAIAENPDLAYAIPKEGTNLWFDVMAIPKGAKNVEGAHKFMDFLNRPEIALRNAEYTGYSTPNLAAWSMLPEEVRNDPGAYPGEEVLANTEVFVSLGETLKEYDPVFGLKSKHSRQSELLLTGRGLAVEGCLAAFLKPRSMKGVRRLSRLSKALLMFTALVLLSVGLSGCTAGQAHHLCVQLGGDYIDESILEEFEKETKIRVVYDTYATNEDMYVKIKAGGSAYDVIFPSDYMLTRMIEEGLVQKLDKDQEFCNAVH